MNCPGCGQLPIECVCTLTHPPQPVHYVHDPKEDVNEETSWRSTVPIPNLEIPPGLKPKVKPKDGDLYVAHATKWPNGSDRELKDCTYHVVVVQDDRHVEFTHDPRIVGAVCCMAWQDEARRLQNRALVEHSHDRIRDRQQRVYAALEHALAWRQYADGK